MRQSIEPSPSRRRFLRAVAAAGGTGAVALALDSGRAGATATPGTAIVWRLNAAWGYPAGPKGVTRCRCRACRNHADNKLFFTEADAVAARIHTCCVCQPEAMAVAPDVYAELQGLASGNPSIDRRTPAVTDALAAAALAGDVPTDPSPASCPPVDPTTTDPGSTTTTTDPGSTSTTDPSASSTTSSTSSTTTSDPAATSTTTSDPASTTPATSSTSTTSTSTSTSTTTAPPAPEAVAAVPASTTTSTAPSTTSSVPAAAAAGAGVRAVGPTTTATGVKKAVRTGAEAANARRSASSGAPGFLAFTGGDATPLIAGGVAAVALGAAALRLRTEGAPAADGPSGDADPEDT